MTPMCSWCKKKVIEMCGTEAGRSSNRVTECNKLELRGSSREVVLSLNSRWTVGPFILAGWLSTSLKTKGKKNSIIIARSVSLSKQSAHLQWFSPTFLGPGIWKNPSLPSVSTTKETFTPQLKRHHQVAWKKIHLASAMSFHPSPLVICASRATCRGSSVHHSVICKP